MLERVQKIIAASGLCSKRKAEELISQGRVLVNNNPIKLGDKADSEKDIIKVDGKRILKQEKVYLAFYKPCNVMSSTVPERGKRCILDYVKSDERIFYAGRLDYNAEGLMILTNDGQFANRISHPRYETKKTYVISLDKPVKREDITRLSQGIRLEEYTTRPAKVDIIDAKTLALTIHEGKKHIVKEMMKTLGYTVLRLIRVKVGNIELKGLRPGEYRKLNRYELQQ